MRYLVILVSFLLATTNAAHPMKGKVASKKPTAAEIAAAENALGQCRCDITLHSCDTFCCCDKDCDEDVRAFWTENYNDYCAKNYIQQQYKPRTQCVDSNILFRKNARMGMEITELNGQTCVSMDVGSVFSSYKEEVPAATAAQAVLDPDVPKLLLQNQGLNQQKQAQILDKYTEYYQVGDQVMTKTVTTTEPTKNTPAKEVNVFAPFFLTQSGAFSGVCSNLVGVQFSQDIDSTCQQFISDLKIAGETFLSAATYVPGRGVAAGVKSTAKAIPVTLGTVWKLDTQTEGKKGILTKEYPTFDKGVKVDYDYVKNKPAYAKSGTGCSLTNAVKEVFYTVQSVPTPIEQVGYQIAAVQVDIIIQDTLVFAGTAFCEKTYTAGAKSPTRRQLDESSSNSTSSTESSAAPRRLQKNDQVVFGTNKANWEKENGGSSSFGFKFPMRYGIKYQTKPGKEVSNVVVNRSGNPGYNINFPLLVSSQMGANQLAKVNVNGFVSYDHDDDGKCFDASTNPDSIYNFHNRILKFGQTEQMTCSKSMTVEQLEDYCKSSEWTKQEIFKQFDDNFKFVAKLGNPTLDNIGDWIPLKKKGFPASTVGKWDANSNSCEMVTGYTVLINTSVLGFQNKLQNYIVDATIEAVTERWTHYAGGSASQEFTHFVYLSYVEHIPDQWTAANTPTATFVVPTVPKDLFYPFSLNA